MAARRNTKPGSGRPLGFFMAVGAVIGFTAAQNILPDLKVSLGPLVFDGITAIVGAIVAGILCYLLTGRNPI
jgi:hypothetical protein